MYFSLFLFASRRRHTRFKCDWSSDVCSSDLQLWRSESFPLEARLSLARSSPRIERRSFAAQEHTRDRQPTVHTSSLFAHTEQCIFCPESCPWLPGSLFRNPYQSHTPATARWNCFV